MGLNESTSLEPVEILCSGRSRAGHCLTMPLQGSKCIPSVEVDCVDEEVVRVDHFDIEQERLPAGKSLRLAVMIASARPTMAAART